MEKTVYSLSSKVKEQKSILFFSSSSPNDLKTLYDSGIADILVSYFYIRKAKRQYEELIPMAVNAGGVFMTDSGAHSFQSLADFENLPLSFWEDYLEEYVRYLKNNKHLIYCAANLDIDKLVGRKQVDAWNLKYFKPLEKYMDIVYVSHQSTAENFDGNVDPTGLIRFKQYCQQHKYVGFNQEIKKHIDQYHAIARQYRVRVHGFAWTVFHLIQKYPLHSIDSTTWLMGGKYGSTYQYTGNSFKTWTHKQKDVRKTMKLKAVGLGLDYENIKKDKQYEVNLLNLEAWKEFRDQYQHLSNLKLKNEKVKTYLNYHGKR